MNGVFLASQSSNSRLSDTYIKAKIEEHSYNLKATLLGEAYYKNGYTITVDKKFEGDLDKYINHLKILLVYLNRLFNFNPSKQPESINEEEAWPDAATSSREVMLGTIMQNFFHARKYLQRSLAEGSSLERGDDLEYRSELKEPYKECFRNLEPIFRFCEELIETRIQPDLNERQKEFYEQYPNNELIYPSSQIREDLNFLDAKPRKLYSYSARGKHTFLNSDSIYIPNSEIDQANKPKARIALMLLDGVTSNPAARAEHAGRLIARKLPALIDKNFQELLKSKDLEVAFREAVETAARDFIL